MHEVLVNRLGGLSLPRKSVVRLTDRPDMTLDVYRGRKTTKQQQQFFAVILTGMWPDIPRLGPNFDHFKRFQAAFNTSINSCKFQ